MANNKNISSEDAIQDKIWKAIMDEKIKTIEKNGTWELTTLPKGHKCIGVKWIYKKKKNDQGHVEKYKVRLIAKDYKQQVSIDYEEMFTPVTCMKIIRLLISIMAQFKWSILQIDIKSAFLNRFLEEEVYVN